MPEQNAVLAIYGTSTGAEEAVKKLHRAGIDMRTLSIIGKDRTGNEQVVGFYNSGDRMKYWGKAGGFWGGFWELLFGSAFFAIPGVGPVLVAGPLVTWIVRALEGTGIVRGVSIIGSGLYGMGVPKNNVLKYELAVKRNNLLLVVYGTATEAENARDIIASTWPINVTLHQTERDGSPAR
jgi:hypothetical protein